MRFLKKNKNLTQQLAWTFNQHGSRLISCTSVVLDSRVCSYESYTARIVYNVEVFMNTLAVVLTPAT